MTTYSSVASNEERRLLALCQEKDSELLRLRERVEELERATDIAIEINNKHQERVNDFERSLAATKHEAGLVCLDMDAAEERSRLLLEAVRWCLEHGASTCDNGQIIDNGSSYGGIDLQIYPPAHLAPLIAEAGEKKP